MSFTCKIIGKDGTNLLEKYGINSDLSGVMPADEDGLRMERKNVYGYADDHYAEYSLEHVKPFLYKDYYVATYLHPFIIREIQRMIKKNLSRLGADKPLHYSGCLTCTCPPLVPETWNVEDAKKFLQINPEEVAEISVIDFVETDK